MNMARQMMPQAGPTLPPMPTQGLDIRGLLQQIQQIGGLGGQVDAAWSPHEGSGYDGKGKPGGLAGLPPLTPTKLDVPQITLHQQLAGMQPAQALHTLGRAKMVAATMQHLRMLRQHGGVEVTA
jgi:hypothetical protein